MPTEPPPAKSPNAWLPLLGASVLLVAASAAWFWWRPPASPQEQKQVTSSAGSSSRPVKPPPVSEAYAGSQACRDCHPQIAEHYAQHPMSRSFAAVADAAGLEDYSAPKPFEKGGCRYRVDVAEDGVYHHESYTDGDGLMYDQRIEVQYAIGSGQRGRSYFIDRGGLLFVSPISWYSAEQRWDLSPSYPERNHMRFERPVSGRCLGCHAGRVQHEPGQNDRFLRHAVKEAQISCERCHGPARDHVNYHRNPAEATGDDPIVNPAKLTASKRDSVCNQCHLQGADEVRRYGRSDFDFRPGMDLGEIWTIFVAGTGVESSGETAAVSQVQQMYASRCYTASDGKLGCISCHDPHRVPTEQEKAAEYNRKCQTCHAQTGCALPEPQRLAAPAVGSCIHCHMPRLGASNVPHTTQTDHRVLRAPHSPHPDREVAEPPQLRIFDLDAVPLDDHERSRAEAIHEARLAEVMQDREGGAQAVDKLRSVYELDPGDIEVADAYGVSLALAGEHEQAIAVWRRALASDTSHEGLLYSLGMTHFNRGEHRDALQYVDRLTAVNPWRSDYQGQRARVLLANGMTEEAIAVGQYAAQLNPSLPLVYEWLAFACDKAGRATEADQYRRLYQRAMRR